MSDLEETSEILRKQLDEAETKISQVSKMKGPEKQQAITKMQKKLKQTKNLLKSYEFGIEDYEGKAGVESHKSQLKQFQSKLIQLEKSLQYSRNQGVTTEDLFAGRNKGPAQTTNSSKRQQLIQEGHNVQKQGQQALQRILKNIHSMDEQADSINLQLNRQIQQLDKIYDNLKDTETTLKRAQKHLKYFARQVYTDKLMICLIIIIIIAIIVIIILSIVGKTPNLKIDTLK